MEKESGFTREQALQLALKQELERWDEKTREFGLEEMLDFARSRYQRHIELLERGLGRTVDEITFGSFVDDIVDELMEDPDFDD